MTNRKSLIHSGEGFGRTSERKQANMQTGMVVFMFLSELARVDVKQADWTVVVLLFQTLINLFCIFRIKSKCGN